MVTKKDFDSAENKDLQQNDEAMRNDPVNDGRLDEDEAEPGKTEVKNAHATGDGAYGRSDKSLTEGNKKKGTLNEPPY